MAEEETVYVAVGDGVNESTLMLWWAFQRFSHRKFCILHVHRPSVQGQRRMETSTLSNKLDEYVLICNQSGIQAQMVYMETESIEKGILELIFRHKIQNLIMGAAADKHYDVKMLEPKSTKAIYVKSHAPSYCHIWFICRGVLIFTREARFDSLCFVNPQENIMTPQSNMILEAVLRANMLESMCREELRKRMETEAEVELVKNQHNKTLAKVADQKQVITKYKETVKQLEGKVKLREKERVDAIKLSKKKLPNSPEYFLTLPSSKILTATSESDQSSQLLCEGELGNIYKAVLYHTEVTLRFLREDELSVLQNEVKILSKFRHPNVATLIGASPETPALVYEHLPNGSLEDRLRCKGNTQPLLWHTRIKIAVELCSALIFLHSHGVLHGALRTSCVLLDSNFSCKIIDFRSSTDPKFRDTTEPYPRRDVYLFGLILLELLTGRTGFSVIEQVQYGLDQDDLKSQLDTSAGEWSFLLAGQLARLGLRCCNADPWSRPNLKTDVWKVLEPMRLSCGSASSFRVGEAPSYFVCPILQEVMEDPHIAADGYTYEAEALKQWLDRRNETSPMTNLPLDDTHLVPNRALRSAIQEWLQLQRR